MRLCCKERAAGNQRVNEDDENGGGETYLASNSIWKLDLPAIRWHNREVIIMQFKAAK